MSKELQPRRLNRISGAFATALIIAACESNAPVATPTSVRTPEATPSPVPTLLVTPTPEATSTPVVTIEPTPVITPEVTPSPVVTPTPTQEVTPSPSIEPTPSPVETPVTPKNFVDSVIEEANGNFPKISLNQLKNGIDEALASDPEAANKVLFPDDPKTLAEFIEQDFNQCKTGKGGGNPEQNKSIGCGTLGIDLFDGYNVNKNGLFLHSLENLIYYVKNNLTDYSEGILDRIRSYNP
jgi:hypothetical protein